MYYEILKSASEEKKPKGAIRRELKHMGDRAYAANYAPRRKLLAATLQGAGVGTAGLLGALLGSAPGKLMMKGRIAGGIPTAILGGLLGSTLAGSYTRSRLKRPDEKQKPISTFFASNSPALGALMGALRYRK